MSESDSSIPSPQPNIVPTPLIFRPSFLPPAPPTNTPVVSSQRATRSQLSISAEEDALLRKKIDELSKRKPRVKPLAATRRRSSSNPSTFTSTTMAGSPPPGAEATTKALEELLALQKQAAEEQRETSKQLLEQQRQATEKQNQLFEALLNKMGTLSDNVQRAVSAEPHDSTTNKGAQDTSGSTNDGNASAVGDDDENGDGSLPRRDQPGASPESAESAAGPPTPGTPGDQGGDYWLKQRSQARHSPRGLATSPSEVAAAAKEAAIHLREAKAKEAEARKALEKEQAAKDKAAGDKNKSVSWKDVTALDDDYDVVDASDVESERHHRVANKYAPLVDPKALDPLTDDVDPEEWFDNVSQAIEAAVWATDDSNRAQVIRQHALGLLAGCLRGRARAEWNSLSTSDKSELKKDLSAWHRLIIEPFLDEPVTRKLAAERRTWQQSKESCEDYYRFKKSMLVRARPSLALKENRKELLTLVWMGIDDPEYSTFISEHGKKEPSERVFLSQVKNVDTLAESRKAKAKEAAAKKAAKRAATARDEQDFRRPSRDANSRGDNEGNERKGGRGVELFDPKRMGSKMVDGKKVSTYERENGTVITLRRPCRHCKGNHPDFACGALSKEGKSYNVEGGPRWAFTDRDVELALEHLDGVSSGHSSSTEEGDTAVKALFLKGSAQKGSN